MQTSAETKMASSVKLAFRQYSEALIIALLIAFILRFFVLTTYKVTTDQMSPALVRGDFVLASKISLGVPIPFKPGQRWRPVWPMRGEVVIFDCPTLKNRVCVKRLVGLPGDRVEILRGSLLVNRQVVASGGSLRGIRFGPVVVPPSRFFVLSDQLKSSTDSRQWGSLPESYLRGKVVSIWASIDWSKPWASGLLPSVRWERIFNTVD